MRDKMDQLLETILALAKREDELRHSTVAKDVIPAMGSTSHSWPVVTNLRYIPQSDYTPSQMEYPIYP